MVFYFSIKGILFMKSILEQIQEFLVNHKVIAKTIPSTVELETVSYAVYDNKAHEIIGIVNLSEEQANELNKAFRHKGDYHMQYVVLKIFEQEGDKGGHRF